LSKPGPQAIGGQQQANRQPEGIELRQEQELMLQNLCLMYKTRGRTATIQHMAELGAKPPQIQQWIPIVELRLMEQEVQRATAAGEAPNLEFLSKQDRSQPIASMGFEPSDDVDLEEDDEDDDGMLAITEYHSTNQSNTLIF